MGPRAAGRTGQRLDDVFTPAAFRVDRRRVIGRADGVGAGRHHCRCRGGLTANEFTPAPPIDDEGGGLLRDPVADNEGLLPDNVRACINFDGNGCADYPPPRNHRDSEGQCGQEGVPPPSDPTGG
ncbi:MAG TPA: hypothetical protein PLQ54_03695 [Armatimonadota bacterium]|nr:hypothetical protein [Armatimonadota bacterium]